MIIIDMKDHGKFIRNLYLIYLKREPDRSGFAHWMDRLKNESLKKVLMDFVSSEEAVYLYGERRVEMVKSFIEKVSNERFLLYLIFFFSFFRNFLKAVAEVKVLIKIFISLLKFSLVNF